MRRMNWLWGLLAALLMLLPATIAAQETQPSSQPTSVETVDAVDSVESPWSHILSIYVDANGRFDYAGLMANQNDLDWFNFYVSSLAVFDPSVATPEEQQAFWLNAYNALAIKGVLDSYPISSVMDVAGFFDGVSYSVAGVTLTLNEIDTNFLAPLFPMDPIYHFGLNPAAVGGPPLRNEAFSGENLQEQLAEQLQIFVRTSTTVTAEDREIRVSPVFEWFNDEFTAHGGIRAYVAEQLREGDAGQVRRTVNFIVFGDYDWSLNASQ